MTTSKENIARKENLCSNSLEELRLKGAAENNLKNLDLSIKHNSFTVISGPSGSGKSTLAFDTIYAEGARRYIETFSPYTRQFLDRLHQPKIASIQGVRPALALEQRNRINSSRSTVGTSTEINDYLKNLWSLLAQPQCLDCNQPISCFSPAMVLRLTLAKIKAAERLYVCFPVKLQSGSKLESLLSILTAEGFTRYWSEENASAKSLFDLAAEEFSRLKSLTVVLDRTLVPEQRTEEFTSALLGSINQAFTYGHGQLSLIRCAAQGELLAVDNYFEDPTCPSCGLSLPKPRPQIFTFNSPIGACEECQGFGKILSFSEELVVPDPRKSLSEGALACFNTEATKHELKKLLAYCARSGINTKTAWQKLTSEQKRKIFQGDKKEKYAGVLQWFARLQEKRHKMHIRVLLSRYREELNCSSCQGSRLKKTALAYLVKDKTISDIWQLSIEDALEFFKELQAELELSGLASAREIQLVLAEVISRLGYLQEIGLPYLTLDRSMRSLSGGESQRVNLTSILGAQLVNTLLVLDEPTIGLHHRDTGRLINSIKSLRDRGNTVLVVEHETEVIKAADEVIDIGPGSGKNGGQVVYQGSPAALKSCKDSLTAKFLREDLQLRETKPSGAKDAKLKLKGLRAHNLKNISLEIPLNKLLTVCGVSGSGKSTLVKHCLFEGYQKIKTSGELGKKTADISSIDGLEQLQDIIIIDQSPLGKTPRANAATYCKAWEIIRLALADTEEAVRLGLSKSAFSFNVPGGRCDHCDGAGQIKVEMQFLADVYVSCEVCNGQRFKDAVLGVRLAGLNVLELLELSLEQSLEVLAQALSETAYSQFKAAVSPLISLGLGYLRLGHPLSELSGGEAQRLRIASYLAVAKLEKARENKGILFILDEPTTGLHPVNIQDLLKSLRLLLEAGHSVLLVEHNLSVIAESDYLIDLGPEGGEGGGELVAKGSPRQLAAEAELWPKSLTALALRNLLQEKTLALPKPKQAKLKPQEEIQIIGARQNNLKNLSVEIPHNKLCVVSGVSGSGKSTLAFELIFAEGQRRYIDCLSPYARQFMKQMSRPEVDRISALPPTIAVSQKTSPPLGVSTIATTTELYQYLRLLYSKLGTQHCPQHDLPIVSSSAQQIVEQILAQNQGERLFIYAPVVSGRKGYYNDLFERALKAEITEAFVDGEVLRLESGLRLERHKEHWISLLVGSFSSAAKTPDLLLEVIEHALLLGSGTVELKVGDKYSKPQVLSRSRMCPQCQQGYRALDPQDFSFRSLRGVCESCAGTGKRLVKGQSLPCADCGGARIKALGRSVYLFGRRIHELTNLKPQQLLEFFKSNHFEERVRPVSEPILKEIEHRLSVLISVGLDYLALDRDSHSISGGEAQRLRLAKALGSPLSGVCYVLDEPSIGLHPADQTKLIDTLYNLRDNGNTLLVVEHDEDIIRRAEQIIDIGPGSGEQGGELVFNGSVKELLKVERSRTAQALKQREARRKHPEIKESVCFERKYLEVRGAKKNNLKNVHAKFALSALNVLIGLSGSGKSSLLHACLVPLLEEALREEHSKAGERGVLSGAEGIQRLVEIDQVPVGKTATSTPCSYLGIMSQLRELYASLPEARALGLKAAYFSYNSGKGRCASCQGRGFVSIPLGLLPAAEAVCDTCNGRRYNETAESILYHGLSVGELLQCTINQCRDILQNHSRITRMLDNVIALGLGYLTLGQPTHTLSGGEIQRLKIAKEIGAREAVSTVYILDEPTTGLHMSDVDRLINMLKKLVAQGNTVIVIEHNLDVWQAADQLLELGPRAGEDGGQLLFMGTPSELREFSGLSPSRVFCQ